MISPGLVHNLKTEIPFEDDGFITGAVVLLGLDMPIILSRNQYFKFDGVVLDMWQYLHSLFTDMRYYLDKFIGDSRFKSGFNFGLVWND